MTHDVLSDRRILVVEDDAMLAFGYEELLKDCGAEVIGPAATIEEANKLAAVTIIAAALLDIRLGDREVWPVADVLASKGVPFVFCTGHYDRGTLPTQWLDRPIITKPGSPKDIINVLANLISAR